MGHAPRSLSAGRYATGRGCRKAAVLKLQLAPPERHAAVAQLKGFARIRALRLVIRSVASRRRSNPASCWGSDTGGGLTGRHAPRTSGWVSSHPPGHRSSLPCAYRMEFLVHESRQGGQVSGVGGCFAGLTRSLTYEPGMTVIQSEFKRNHCSRSGHPDYELKLPRRASPEARSAGSRRSSLHTTDAA